MKAVRSMKIKYLLIGFLLMAFIVSLGVGILHPLAEDVKCSCTPTDGVHSSTCALYTPAVRSSTGASAVSSIYTTAEYSDTPTVLTESGAVINWARSDIKYLAVNLSNLDGLSAGQHYRLIVTLDPVVYASNIPTYTDTWAKSCTFDENDSIPINSGGIYTVNNSGTLTYDIDPNFSSGSLSLTLNYDWRFSDSVEGSDLGYNNKYGTPAPLVRVELLLIDGESSTTVSDHNLKNAISTVGRTLSSPVEYSVDNFSITAMNSSQQASISILLAYNEFVEELVLELTLPYYVLDGVTYAMDFTGVNQVSVASGTPNYTFEREVLPNGAIKGTFRFTDYLSYSSYAYFGITMPFSEPALASGTHLFTGGRVSLSRDNGSVVVLDNKKLPDMTMTDANAPNVTLYKHKKNYSVSDHGDNITFVGMFAVGNTGGINTGAVTIHERFETKGTNNIGVTSLKIMLPIGQTTTIYFTLEDSDGNIALDGAEFSYELTNVNTAVSRGVVFSRAMLPEELRSYYFASITYVIDIPANTNLYAESYHQFHGGTIWGEIYSGTGSTTSHHDYAVYKGDFKEQGNFGEALIEWRQAITINSTNQTPYGIDKLSVSLPANNKNVNTVTVNPGEKVNIHANLFIYDYPYSGDCDLDKIGFAIILPRGVSVLTGEISVKYNLTGLPIDVDSVTQREVTVGDGKQVLWDIRLDPSATVGYFSEMVTALENGERISIVIPVVSELTTPQQDIVLNAKLFVYGEGQPNATNGGNVANNATKDVYGLLGSGFSSTDLVGCSSNVSNATKIVISINHPSALLDISDKIYIEGAGIGSGTLYSSSELDRFIYRLDIECTRGGTADNFFYYIPIPRSSQNSYIDFLSNQHGIGMVLASEVNVDAENAVMKVQYTTDGNLNYDSAADAVWLDFNEVTDLSDVTMVKITTEEGKVISNGAEITVTVACKYDDSLVFSAMAGTSLEWRSKGYYEYTIGNTTNAGDRATVGGTLAISYRTSAMTVTLTAAKDMQPTAPDTREVTVSIYEFIGSTFNLSQSFTVRNVVASSLTLVNATNQQFAAMTSSQSNTNFKLEVKLNTSTTRTLLAGSEASLGTVAANSNKSSLNLKLYNGNVITENAIMRSVSFDLVGNNGITIPVTVIIKRELSPAEPEDPSILAGKHYSLYDTINDRVSLSANAAFTVQYVLDLIPKNYEAPVLYVSGISKGEIIMIDWTDVHNPKYYHASVSASVPLTKFNSLDADEPYVYNSSDTTERTHSLLFIFNMKESPAPQGTEGRISLVREAKSGVSIEQSLYFNSVGQRSFSSTATSAAEEGVSFRFSYTSTSQLEGAADYEFYNKALALVVSGGSLPSDLYVEADGKKYYRNVDGKFIIPLSDDAQRSSGSIELTAVSSALSEQAYLTCAVWLCATGDASKPSSGTPVTQTNRIELTARTSDSALKVLRISDNYITSGEVEKAVTLLLERRNTDNIPVTLELQRKVAHGYTTMSTLSTNISGATVGDNGVYTVYSDQLSIMLNPYSVEPGTYRILFKVYDTDGTVTEVAEGFIIAE